MCTDGGGEQSFATVELGLGQMAAWRTSSVARRPSRAGAWRRRRRRRRQSSPWPARVRPRGAVGRSRRSIRRPGRRRWCRERRPLDFISTTRNFTVYVATLLSPVWCVNRAKRRDSGVLGRWLPAICQAPSFPETPIAGAGHGQDARGLQPCNPDLLETPNGFVEEGEAPSRAEAINLNLKDCKRLIPVQEHDHWRMD